MINKLTTKLLVGGVLLVAVLGVGLHTNTIKLPITNIMSLQYIADFSDDRALVGASHNIFVGKVIRQTGSKSRLSAPKTQFEVEMIYNIKGDLQGLITVDQTGGYKNGVLYLVSGGDVVGPAEDTNTDSLLEPGTTYLFAARYSETDNWYTIISHPNARKVLSEDADLDKERLERLAQNDEKVVVLNEAYKNEILLEADILNNNTRNSYESLQENK